MSLAWSFVVAVVLVALGFQLSSELATILAITGVVFMVYRIAQESP